MQPPADHGRRPSKEDPGVDLNVALRRLPKVDEVLASAPVRDLLERAPRWAVLTAVRAEIDRLRAAIVAGRGQPEPLESSIDVNPMLVAAEVRALLRPSLT